MIFLTVGTQFPFDRLVKAVDDIFDAGFIDDEIFAQIGESLYKPRNFESVDFLDKRVFDCWVQRVSGIISHAGMGIITMALESHKPLLVMPRLKRYGEVVNDHQVTIAKNFESLGHLLVAYDVEEISDKIKSLKSFSPRKKLNRTKQICDRITVFLKDLDNHVR